MSTQNIWNIIKDDPTIRIVTKYCATMSPHPLGNVEYDEKKHFYYNRYYRNEKSCYFQEFHGTSSVSFSFYKRFTIDEEEKILHWLEDVVMLLTSDMEVIYNVDIFEVDRKYYKLIGDNLYYDLDKITLEIYCKHNGLDLEHYSIPLFNTNMLCVPFRSQPQRTEIFYLADTCLHNGYTFISLESRLRHLIVRFEKVSPILEKMYLTESTTEKQIYEREYSNDSGELWDSPEEETFMAAFDGNYEEYCHWLND